MRFDIAKSLNGDNIVYLARDTGGIVRLRANSIEEIQEAIKEYNERLATQSRETSKAKQVAKEDNTDVSPTDIEPSTTDSSEEETKQEEPVKELAPLDTEETEVSIDSPNTILEATVPNNEESQKRYLHEQAEEKKKPASKKSFWEKLK